MQFPTYPEAIMATAAQLTPRQREIKALLDKDQTPKQIAKKLRITENAVYQQLRRIRNAGGSAKPAKAAAKPKAATPTSSRSRSRASTRKPSAKPAAARREPQRQAFLSPLDAISMRRQAIEDGLTATAKSLADTKAAYEQALAEHENARANHRDELAQLARAEAALKGEPVKPERKSAGRPKAAGSNGGKPADAEESPRLAAAPDPQPVQAAEPEPEPEPALVGEEPEPALVGEEFERPGVATVSEFAQDAPDDSQFGES